MNWGRRAVWGALALTASVSLQARAETATIAEVGPWKAFGGVEGAEGLPVCGVSQQMDDNRFVSLRFYRGHDTVTMHVSSKTWQLTDDDKRSVRFMLGSSQWDAKEGGAAIKLSDGRPGLEFEVEVKQLDDFIRDFRAASQMQIQLPGLDRDWQVSLTGSNAIVDVLERCRRYLKPDAPPLLGDSMQRCLGKKKSTADEQLEACNMIVTSGLWRDKHARLLLDWRGSAYRRKGDLDRAIADYDEALRADPDVASVHNDRGMAWSDKGDLDRAMSDFNDAIRLNARSYFAYSNRGYMWFRKGDLDRAIADYDESLRINPKFTNALTNRGLAWETKGDLDKAIADYSDAMKINEKDVSARKIRGRAYFFKGDYVAAAADLLSAADLEDDPYTMIWRFLARTRAGQDAAGELSANAARLKTKEWPYPVIDLYLGQRSVDEMRSAAKDDDQKCEATFYLGEWDLLRGNAAEARSLLQTAADSCPKDFVEYEAANVELKRLAN